MRGTLTHLATVEHYEETGETTGDGAGGTIEKHDWVAVVDKLPCRYEPAGRGFVREDQGGRVYESPRVVFPARSVGHMESFGEYKLDVGEGDDWRLTVAGVDGTYALVDIDAHYKGPNRPSHVVIEVERTDTEDA